MPLICMIINDIIIKSVPRGGVYMNWKEIRSKQRKNEFCWCILPSCVSIIFGIICEVLVKNDIVFLYVNDLPGVSLTLLQIIAATATLSIAIISLLCGQNDLNVFGIPYNDYCFNRKPVLLKQNRLNVILFLFILFSALFHIKEWYNLVISSFIVTTIVIIYDVRYIYKIFVNTEPIKNEIKIYFEEQIKSTKTRDDVKVDYLNNFVEYWKNLLPSQSDSSFENHSDILIQIGDQSLSLLKPETECNSLLFDKYQNCSKKVVSFLLQDDRLSERGLLLLSRIYDGAWKNYIGNKNHFITDIHFNILSDLIFDINEAIFILPTSKLEKLFRFKGMSLSRFSDNVLRINYCISDKESRKNEISACFYFLFSISNKISTSENIDKELWMRNIDNLWCSTANIKEEYKEEFEKDVVKTYFYYVKGFVLSGELDIVKNGLYLGGFNNMYTLQKSQLQFLPFLIHCYIYYIAEYETIDCVSEKVKKACVEFLFDERIIGNYKSLLQLLYRNPEKSLCLYNFLLEELNRQELFPRTIKVKTLIMDSVVQSYVYYTLLICYKKYIRYDQEFLSKIIGLSNIYSAISLIKSAQADNYVKLKKLLLFSGCAKEALDFEASSIINIMNKEVEKQLKSERISNAIKAQEQFNKLDKNKLEQEISIGLLERITSDYGLILRKTNPKTKADNIFAMRFCLPTEYINDDFLTEYGTMFECSFVDIICDLLNRKGLIKSLDRSLFDDDDLINAFKEKNVTHLIGNGRLFYPNDYKNEEMFTAYKETINTDALIDGSLCIAVNMNNLKIELREVTVIIRTPDFSDVGIKNISDPSNIPYDLLNGYQASFTESELHEYISMQNKIVEMYLKIAIECPDKDLGYYLD